jgi:hypothetical protein
MPRGEHAAVAAPRCAAARHGCACLLRVRGTCVSVVVNSTRMEGARWFATTWFYVRRPRLQLRNPLHAMLAAVTVMEEEGVGPEERAWQLRSLRNGIDLMVGITNDVLDIQALGAGKLRLRLMSTDLRELLSG